MTLSSKIYTPQNQRVIESEIFRTLDQPPPCDTLIRWVRDARHVTVGIHEPTSGPHPSPVPTRRGTVAPWLGVLEKCSHTA